ncbi:hypothetical protein [Kineosporia sp. NBRC 101731]|uniref:hypothetical protein n=1 Tax=Kineosporia sp. NBRC 101731 TaxID=3032199 RepID=UPI0025524734|nr:hypothetical protein [Kineosporia sp. NBRC 101731]
MDVGSFGRDLRQVLIEAFPAEDGQVGGLGVPPPGDQQAADPLETVKIRRCAVAVRRFASPSMTIRALTSNL